MKKSFLFFVRKKNFFRSFFRTKNEKKFFFSRRFSFKGTFKLPIDENLIQKTLKTLSTDFIDETLLDELQMKVKK